MRRGLPTAFGMLFSLALAASTVQSTAVSAQTIGQIFSGQVPSGQVSSGVSGCACGHPFKQLLAAESLLCRISRQERGKLWPRLHDVWRGQCTP